MKTLIVSCYYKIPSKADHSKYMLWIEKFLKSTGNHIVFFTTEDLIPDFLKIRDTNITYITELFSNLNAIKQYGYDFWTENNKLDPEKYHTPELGILWYEKKEFVIKTIEKYPADVYIWCDAGCVRQDAPIYTFGSNIDSETINKLNIQILNENISNEFYRYPDIKVAGAIMYGNKEAWLNYKNIYDFTLQKYVSNKLCVNSDQYITGSALYTNPEYFNQHIHMNSCIDKWFFFLEKLSIPNTRTFNIDSFKFTSYSNDIAFVECMSKGQLWNSDFLKELLKYLPDNGTFLDVGGHIGTHCVYYGKNRPNAKIITFEPQSNIRKLLHLNIAANNLDNIDVIPYGIGHMNKNVRLASDFTSDGYDKNIKVNYNSNVAMNFGGLGITNSCEGEEISIISLDSIELDNIKYIKMDIEGAEALAVWGARHTISKFKPILLLEEGDKDLKYKYIADIPELQDFSISKFLDSLGYKKIKITNTDNLYINI